MKPILAWLLETSYDGGESWVTLAPAEGSVFLALDSATAAWRVAEGRKPNEWTIIRLTPLVAHDASVYPAHLQRR